jgi:hypothetical protein
VLWELLNEHLRSGGLGSFFYPSVQCKGQQVVFPLVFSSPLSEAAAGPPLWRHPWSSVFCNWGCPTSCGDQDSIQGDPQALAKCGGCSASKASCGSISPSRKEEKGWMCSEHGASIWGWWRTAIHHSVQTNPMARAGSSRATRSGLCLARRLSQDLGLLKSGGIRTALLGLSLMGLMGASSWAPPCLGSCVGLWHQTVQAKEAPGMGVGGGRDCCIPRSHAVGSRKKRLFLGQCGVNTFNWSSCFPTSLLRTGSRWLCRRGGGTGHGPEAEGRHF